MDRESLRGFMAIGFFVGGGGFLMALLLPPDSGEFVVSLCSGGVGLTLIVLILLVHRLMQ
ncbi:MAG: hypothetical protein ACFE0Q_10075 [Anaerolineae bacterium]